MRLTCPKCSAQYDVADGMIPGTGRHVQCSACHTRWFVHGRGRTVQSEAQIIHRLEAWRPRPVAVPDPVPDPAPAPLPVAEPASGAAIEPIAEIGPEVAAPVSAAPEPFVWEEPPPWPQPSVPPEVQRPQPLTAGAAELDPALATPRRPPLTLDVADMPAEVETPPRRGRFWLGLVLALIVVGLCFLGYIAEDEIAVRIPVLAPALAAFTDWIDGLRESLAAVGARQGG